MNKNKFTDYRIVKKRDDDYPERLARVKDVPEKLIYYTLQEGTQHIDQIVERVKIPIIKCLKSIMSLEFKGFVETTINNYYRRVE